MRCVRTQRALCADTHDPVHDDVRRRHEIWGRGGRVVADVTAGGSQSPPSPFVELGTQRDGVDASATPGQRSSGEQSITAVVPGPDQQHDPGARDPGGLGNIEDHPRQASRRPGHQVVGGDLLHHGGLGRVDRRHVIGRAHELNLCGLHHPPSTDSVQRRAALGDDIGDGDVTLHRE